MNRTGIVIAGTLLLSTLLACSCTPIPDQPVIGSKPDRMDSLMQVFVDRTGFNGVVLVYDPGGANYSKAFGYANFEWKVPNTSTTRFKLASLGKQFTALLIMQLVEAGKLNLDDKLSKYVPEMPSKTSDRITVRQLLNHTSGVPNYHVIPDFENNIAKRSLSHAEFLDLFEEKELLFDPGTSYQYSNLGYFLLALVAERVSAVPYNALIRSRIFGPAGMKDTFLEDSAAVFERAAAGYVNNYTRLEPARYRDPSSVFGAGHVASTVEDLFRYDQALRSGKLLSAKYQEQMHVPGRNNYGFGWWITRYPVPRQDSVTLVYHDGGTSGAATVMYRFLENDRCVLVLSNVSPYDCDQVARGLARILHDRPYELPKRSLVAEYARTLEGNGIEAATFQFRSHRANEAEFELDGVAFNLLGYQYLRANRLKEAVAVFELNVESFPNIGDPYDSLAEAYMALGKNEQAIANYTRALELDPNNSNATNMLKELMHRTEVH